ncbi:hypothetical protein ENKNEFLB_00774 [Nocardioides aquaticus]|uniref:WD40 repeat domain-containing protein n=1 Tax=Nocardioides aquaticus TaxID=160826 RepID=A0ABX8EE86_9ACTN|nr:hypothetical protein [Nocardioides aquaticus]QVT78397.1 hypothetical protein ENKNEFLB_00774 [Nocardioides aquaticus]
MGTSTTRQRLAVAIGAGCLALTTMTSVAPAQAAEQQPEVVGVRASAVMPRLVATQDESQPRVNALAELGDTMVAGGSFRAVEQDGRTATRTNVVAFDRFTGELTPTFAPTFNGQVWALAADPDTGSVYVGGKFTTVNGTTRPALAKLDAVTGALDPAFSPRFTGGQINDISLVEVAGVKHLVLAGKPSKKVISLNPATGRNDRWIQLDVTGPLPGSNNGAFASRLAIDNASTRMVVTGNFTTVDGQPRSRLFVADLSAEGATLNSWYYPGFQKSCTSRTPAKIDYLEGVDWSPDGQSFNVAATGNYPLNRSDIWYQRLGDANRANTTVCDAVGRFDLDDDERPAWINYTGGDTVWSVIDTGAAVYAAGHFKFFDNPDGRDSSQTGDLVSGQPAVRRQGVGAINPETGLALRWNPALAQTRLGGRDFLADPTGLWLGNDATRLKGEPRRGLQYVPFRAR